MPVSEMLPPHSSTRGRAGGEAAPGGRGQHSAHFPHLVSLKETMHFAKKEKDPAPQLPAPLPTHRAPLALTRRTDPSPAQQGSSLH